jgi:flavin reductase (DIM6/NTAB) family NADH-FMN oxidoreductase RutF/DNA-binding MarR family transcriptional regulator
MTAVNPPDPKRFRNALGAFATGVTIVTTRSTAGADVGLTANSFNSVSLDPPMVLWSLARASFSLPAFQANPWFAVHVLAADQDGLSHRFATRGADKFAGLELERGHGEVPLLPGCSARFQCHTEFLYEGGDHVIFVGRVEAFDHFERPPLLFHGGRYAVAVEKAVDNLDVPAGAEPDSSFSRDFLIYLLARAHFQLFVGLRRDLEQHGLSEEEWFVLSVLGATPNRTIAELDAMLWYTGRRVTYELVARLAAGGFVTLGGSYDPGTRVVLTEAGRQTVIELVAAAKAFESHAERNLGYGETKLLKRALSRIIRDSDPGPGPLSAPAHDGSE